jgi:hypothetical protein
LASSKRYKRRSGAWSSFRLAPRKLRKERAWSALTVAILVVGLTSWIVFPSLGSSLANGLQTFGLSTATYIYVQPSSLGGAGPVLSPSIIDNVRSLPGVERAYTFASQGFAVEQSGKVTLPNGTISQGQNSYGITSIVLGDGGLPSGFVELSQGRFPNGRQAEVVLTHLTSGFVVGQTLTLQAGFGGGGPTFNATVVGLAALNPLLEHTETAFWNATFLKQQLGDGPYENLFGPNATNSLVVKASSIQAVGVLVGEIKQILGNDFSVSYDATLASSLEAFQAQAAPLYEAIGIISIGFSSLVVFFVSYLIGDRRRWEFGLYMSQGLRLGEVAKVLLFYFVFLGLIAFAISALLSLVLLSLLSFSFESISGTVYVAASPNPVIVLSGLPLTLALSAVAAGSTVWRMRRRGIDALLRDY